MVVPGTLPVGFSRNESSSLSVQVIPELASASEYAKSSTAAALRPSTPCRLGPAPDAAFFSTEWHAMHAAKAASPADWSSLFNAAGTAGCSPGSRTTICSTGGSSDEPHPARMRILAAVTKTRLVHLKLALSTIRQTASRRVIRECDCRSRRRSRSSKLALPAVRPVRLHRQSAPPRCL